MYCRKNVCPPGGGEYDCVLLLRLIDYQGVFNGGSRGGPTGAMAPPKNPEAVRPPTKKKEKKKRKEKKRKEKKRKEEKKGEKERQNKTPQLYAPSLCS